MSPFNLQGSATNLSVVHFCPTASNIAPTPSSMSSSYHTFASSITPLDFHLHVPADCAQICRNTPGSYSCSCVSGYRLSSDGKSCLGEKPMHAQISHSYAKYKELLKCLLSYPFAGVFRKDFFLTKSMLIVFAHPHFARNSCRNVKPRHALRALEKKCRQIQRWYGSQRLGMIGINLTLSNARFPCNVLYLFPPLLQNFFEKCQCIKF